MKFHVEAGKTLSVGTTFSFIYCKRTNGSFYIKFKDGQDLPFNENCYYRRPDTVNSLFIYNPNDFELIVEMVFAFGEYGDNSTTISQKLQIINAIDESLDVNEKQYKLKAIEEITFDDTGVLNIDPAGAKKIRIQNISNSNVKLYSANGFILIPLGTEELTLSSAFNVYGNSGDKIVFARFE